ncbi:MAG: beta-carotene ketolase [Oscillatoriales cyanobacterium RM2_1_1]|nr:beta-carotene ketolase [Oscillatoriales cyanobacterium SM2_3_0]NJO45080.1 beta-carotene ketolase [Oscillatoriales cyanobacterium RM2_1_1]
MPDDSTLTLKLAQTDLWLGLVIANIIIFLWLISLAIFLRLDLAQVPLMLIVVGVLVRSFLHTGLFIITHEAIHGAISSSPQVNKFIGNITAFLYAWLLYKVLAENHRLHHRHPASDLDPDFHPQNPGHFIGWYGSFMKEYQKGKQAWVLFVGMTVVFWIFIGLNVSLVNIILFWLLPILLSSLQLFTFGIFLPHRTTKAGYSDRHRARSTNYSVFLSFITCYHFGYHWEHHRYPDLPWYKLPSVHQPR